ncbi:NAD(P)H-dependent oxidoreductase [Chitinophaga sp.]|uniref:NADPH-dependent FMN reductase n=1 Tax=Chitinophaga sp. TaxID=1869181 RepID=UPI0031D7FC98
MSKTIGIIAGSLRKESFSKKVANVIQAMAPPGFEFKMVSIDNLPLYNQDFDDNNEVPESCTAFRKTIKELDGVIFVTPEYNRSIPGALKNAIDVASRPFGKNNWDGKPGAIFSNSPGQISGFGANHHLRQCMVFLNVAVMQQPEVYIAGVNKLFDESGNLKDEKTKAFLQKAVDAYIVWFNKIAG